MTRPKILVAGLFATLLFAATSMAQELPPNEVSVQGTGFFTKDSDNNGITQHTTDSGGLAEFRRDRAHGATIGGIRHSVLTGPH